MEYYPYTKSVDKGDGITEHTIYSSETNYQVYQRREVEKFLYIPKRIAGKTKVFKKAKWTEQRDPYKEFNFLLYAFGGMLSGQNHILRWSDWKPIKWN